MRTLVRNRRRERAAYPYAEARRRRRRAANVNARRWRSRAAFWAEQARERKRKADAFGWMADLPDEGTEDVGPVAVQRARNFRERLAEAVRRRDECLERAAEWEERKPL